MDDAETMESIFDRNMSERGFASFHMKGDGGKDLGHLILFSLKNQCPSKKSCEKFNAHLWAKAVGATHTADVKGADIIPGALKLYCEACQPPAVKSAVCKQLQADNKAMFKDLSEGEKAELKD